MLGMTQEWYSEMPGGNVGKTLAEFQSQLFFIKLQANGNLIPSLTTEY